MNHAASAPQLVAPTAMAALVNRRRVAEEESSMLLRAAAMEASMRPMRSKRICKVAIWSPDTQMNPAC